MRRLCALLAVVAIALSGCTPVTGGPQADTRPAAIADEPRASAARDLVNTWVVEGQTGSTQLLISGDEYVVWDDCGVWTGSWAAYAGTALFGNEQGYDECSTLANRGNTSWLADVTGYDGNSDSMALTDSSGVTVATLTPSATEADLSEYLSQFLIRPETNEDLATRFPEREPLPEESTVADNIAGAWHLVGGEPKTLVTFAEQGNISGYDGCNWFGADKWSYDREGNFLSTGMGMTQRGCLDADAFEVYRMTTAGMVGDELVLYDFEGAEIARAERVGS